MRSITTVTLVLSVGAAAQVASAQDFGDRGSGSAIRDDSVLTANISGFAGGAWHTLNTGGDAPVSKSEFNNPEFTEIGEIAVDSGRYEVVEVAWWEVTRQDGQYVQLVFRTQEGNGFVPFNAKKNGSSIAAYTYEMGGDGNGLDFRHWVTAVYWSELQVSYSYDGGQTVFSDPTIHDPIGSGPWNGTDDEHLGLAFPGDGVNWLQASYKIVVVPAPATALALLAPAGLALGRRRR